jgi:hypothetical protein
MKLQDKWRARGTKNLHRAKSAWIAVGINGEWARICLPFLSDRMGRSMSFTFAVAAPLEVEVMAHSDSDTKPRLKDCSLGFGFGNGFGDGIRVGYGWSIEVHMDRIDSSWMSGLSHLQPRPRFHWSRTPTLRSRRRVSFWRFLWSGRGLVYLMYPSNQRLVWE